MKLHKTALADAVIFEPDHWEDDRGFFLETYRASWFDGLNVSPHFKQDNHSLSHHGVLRGLHLQTHNTQGKLIRVIRGEVFDVAVDLRLDSPSYGQWAGEYLSADNHKTFWIPEGFAHGFMVTSDCAELVYKCTEYYDPASDISIAWNDPQLAIAWPTAQQPRLSPKDTNALTLRDGMGFRNGIWQDNI